MLLTKKNSETRLFTGISKYAKPALLLLASLVIIYFVFVKVSLLATSKSKNPQIISCDAENVVDGRFNSGDYYFSNGMSQSDEQAHSGKYSCKLIGPENQYGLTYEIKDPNAGDRYKVSVWRLNSNRNNQGELVIAGSQGSNLYIQKSLADKTLPNGWAKISVDFVVPNSNALSSVKIYAFNNTNAAIYFDDLEIEYKESIHLDSSFQREVLAIEIGDNGMQKLSKKRKGAIDLGLLETQDDDWVKGKISQVEGQNENEAKQKIKLRLKGDMLDHLMSDKWSFRIKVEDPGAWRRLKTFSIQTPETRNFINEWVLHQFFEREDILSPRYDFIQVSINNQSKGIFAYEEHFEKQLVEYKLRREGPILKFSEDGLWRARMNEKKYQGKSSDYQNSYENSKIVPFKEGKTIASPVLSNQFKIAQDLMYAYKFGSKEPGDIFDIERMAKYYAIIDVMQAHHGIIWHNQRFYYNPINSKLEPIGYDGNGNGGLLPWGADYIGHSRYFEENKDVSVLSNLFTDKKFMEKYIHFLNEFSTPQYINSLFEDLNQAIKHREYFIKEEYSDYRFDKEVYIQHAKKIQLNMMPYSDESVHAYQSSKSNDSIQLELLSFHNLPLEVLGFGRDAKSMNQSISESVWLPSFQPKVTTKLTKVNAPQTANYIFFGLPGVDSVFYSKIIPWSAPGTRTLNNQLFNEAKPQTNDVYQVNGNTLYFPKGKYKISQDIIVPEDFQLNFDAGVELDFINGSKLLSKSRVLMYGTEEEPIKIFSSDGSANGFTILGPKEKSVLSYVQFDGFNTMNYKGWTLTGAVNFHETEVELYHCSFLNNLCEDGLNLIRVEFEMRNCLIGSTFADGLDADFCVGKIFDCQFRNTGNDALDFSTSNISIENCNIYNAGDKGISVGENSTVKVETLNVDGAIIGVASKDLSSLNINSINLKNCEKGFVAFQKKPEYGGANINVKNFTTEKVKFLHVIENGSKLVLKDKVITE